MPTEKNIQSAYELAKARYADFGVDTGSALQALEKIAISLHCWQGDDASGYENPDGELTGGIAVTGNYPGKARTADQLRADLDLAYSLIPGTHRLNLHSIYWESDQKGAAQRQVLNPSTSAAGWIGPRPITMVWISTPPAFRTPWPTTVSPFPAATRVCASSGLSTASPAARLETTSAASWARRP